VEPGWDIKREKSRNGTKDGNISSRIEEVSRTRVKVDRITSLSNDLALAWQLPVSVSKRRCPVRQLSVLKCPIQFPAPSVYAVSSRRVFFQKLAVKSKLTLALGKGAGGEAGVADLTKMPHLLIAGATGSGKTVC